MSPVASPRPAPTAAPPPLGDIAIKDFLRDYWQKQPLLIRQALPADACAPLDVDTLRALAEDDGVESRLITAFRGAWQLQHGPFESDDLPALSRKRWTLLVQGVDLHVDAAHELLGRFRFLPDARVDDLMISLASDQGGVGPHVDAYDVFLLQAWGARRWQIAPPGKDQLKPGLPLKILERFEPTQEWLLGPGDLLYLPPGWAHDGVAQGPCMTASIGFRAPSRNEFLREFLAACADELDPLDDPRFTDPTRRASPGRSAQIPDDLHGVLGAWARHWRPDPSAIERFIGCYLTEPKPSVWFESQPLPSPTTLVRRIARTGLRLDRRARMLYRGDRVFINGEAIDSDPLTQAALVQLAEDRLIAPDALGALLQHSPFVDLIRQWVGHGWVRVG